MVEQHSPLPLHYNPTESTSFLNGQHSKTTRVHDLTSAPQTALSLLPTDSLSNLVSCEKSLVSPAFNKADFNMMTSKPARRPTIASCAFSFSWFIFHKSLSTPANCEKSW